MVEVMPRRSDGAPGRLPEEMKDRSGAAEASRGATKRWLRINRKWYLTVLRQQSDEKKDEIDGNPFEMPLGWLRQCGGEIENE